MGMIFGMVAVTPEQIAKLCTSPALANDLMIVAREDGSEAQSSEWLSRLPPERKQQAEERLRQMQSSPEFIAAREEVEQARRRISDFGKIEPELDLDKSWHILHYIFTGDIGPVGAPGDLLMTGDDMGGDTTGYGPPRLHDPEATRRFAEFLQRLDLETLQDRANREAMTAAGVYALPMGPGAEAEFETGLRRVISSYFPLLLDYVVEAARKGNGLLMWLT